MDIGKKHSVIGRLTVTLILAAALIGLTQAVLAYPLSVDGDVSDWKMDAPSQDNVGQINYNSAQEGEYVWNDAAGDERTAFSNPDTRVDLVEFRVTADAANLYFSAVMSGFEEAQAYGVNAPQVRVAIDTNQDGSGETSMGNTSDTAVNANAGWEYLIVTRFGSATTIASPVQLLVYQGDLTTQSVTGTSVINPDQELIEFSVPWSALGMIEPPTLPLRFTVATFRADASDDTRNISDASDALDAITNYGTPGDTSHDTADEVSDGVVDYYFDLFFEDDGDVYPPLAITKTIASDPSPPVAGEDLDYIIVITNQATAAVTNVVLTDFLPSSTTLHYINQVDNFNYYNSVQDAISTNIRWVQGRPLVRTDDWIELADTSLSTTGIYTSRLIDAYNVVNWTDLDWIPRRPYGKPLLDNRQEETAYALGNADMTGNQVLFHMDKISYTDWLTGSMTLPVAVGGVFTNTSGVGEPLAACPAPEPGRARCPGMLDNGRFGKAFSFNSVYSHTAFITVTHDPARYALEAWVRVGVITDTSFILRTDTMTGNVEAGHYSHLLGISDGQFIHYVRDDRGQGQMVRATDVETDTWYHLVGTAQSGGDIKLYVNGDEVGRQRVRGEVWDRGDWYRLGSRYGPTGTTQYFTGDLDEVAVYSRTLSASEVRDHYLRGALQLDLQVRTCDDAACAGDVFVGPGGLTTTVYTDQSSPSASYASVSLTDAVMDARYFQYQAMFATEDPDYTPQLSWVRVRPGHYAVTATQGSCVAVAQAFTCTLGTLSVGQGVTVSAGADISTWALGPITNTATIISPMRQEITATAAITDEADLIITKYDEGWYDGIDYGSSDPASPGSPMTYTVRIRNDGPSVARDVTVTDRFPVSATVVNATVFTTTYSTGGQCITDVHAVTCTFDTLAPTYDWEQEGIYDWEQIVIRAIAPITEGMMTNHTTITATTTDTIDGNNVATETTRVTPVADVWVAKRASHALVDPGDTLTYAITVTNQGPYTATSVIAMDTLPLNLEGYAITGGDWDCDSPSHTVVCSLIQPLTPTASASFQITVTAPSSGFLTNNVYVTVTQQYDTDPNNNWATAYASVRPVADLTITKSESADPVDAGTPLTYTVRVTNTGPVDAGALTTTLAVRSGRRIRIPVQPGHARPPRTAVRLDNVPGLIENMTVTLHNLSHSYPNDMAVLLAGPNGRGVILMANTGGGSDADNLTLTFNDAGVAVSEPLTDTVVYRPTNNGLSEDFGQGAPPGPYADSFSAFQGMDPNGQWWLFVIDTVFSDGGEIAGGWSLQVTARTTDTVVVTDTLPSTLVDIQDPIVPTNWFCELIANVAECETYYLPVGKPVTLVISTTAPLEGGVITNTAEVTSTLTDYGPLSNTAVITTLVAPVADLCIHKMVSPGAVVTPAETITYTLTFSNVGTGLATDVRITDTVPLTLTVTEVQSAGIAITDTHTTPRYVWRVQDLAPGEEGSITIVGTITTTLAANTRFTNTAVITTTALDTDHANNTASVGVDVGVPAALALRKFVTPTEVLSNAGARVTYTLRVENVGDGNAENVVLTDSLPIAAVTFITAIPRQDDGPNPLIWNVGTLGMGDIVTRTVVVTVNHDVRQSFTNTAWVTTTTSGDNPLNNRAEVSVTVINRAPIAADDRYTMPQDTTLTISAPGVLENDSDPDGDTLTALLDSGPTSGTLDLAGNGGFVYTPTVDFVGVDRFTYIARDGAPTTAGALTDTATVVITVTAVNHAPLATNDAYTTPQDTTLTISAPGVLENDSDPDGDTLTALWDSAPTSGTVALAGDGSFVYTPTMGFVGTDSFTYLASDGELTDTATVVITMTAVNHAPLAVNDAYTTPQDTTLMINAPGVLGNDSDPDGDTLTALLDSGPTSGTLDLAGNGGFVYTPTVDFVGVDRFTYIASDGALTDTAAVVITVTRGNTPPTISDIEDQFVDLNAIMGPIPFTIGDAETPAEDLTLTVLSTNTDLVPLDHIVFRGGGTDRTVTITPTANMMGMSLITVTVTDDGAPPLSASDAFRLTVDRALIYLPVIVKNYAVGSDLVVTSVVATSNNIQATIQNQGQMPVDLDILNEFWVDVYIDLKDPNNPPTKVNDIWLDFAHQGFSWGVTSSALPLAPGDILTLTVGDVYYDPLGEANVTWPLEVGTDVYVHVDSANSATTYGAVLEKHEMAGLLYNNITGPVFVTGVFAGQQRIEPPVATISPETFEHLPPRP